jgi:hypothetical protein
VTDDELPPGREVDDELPPGRKVDDELPLGGEVLRDDPPWDAWRPEDITQLLSGVRTPWYVASGWALDLFRGAQTREHEDLEIAVPGGADSFAPFRLALAGYDIEVIGPGRRWPIDDPAFDVLHQTWVSEPATGIYRLDIFREPHDGDIWICRRDETIRLPYGQIIRRTGAGIPYLVPEIVLLFKAKHCRPKDEADLRGTLPLLETAARDWLGWALRRVHPGHPWIELL